MVPFPEYQAYAKTAVIGSGKPSVERHAILATSVRTELSHRLHCLPRMSAYVHHHMET